MVWLGEVSFAFYMVHMLVLTHVYPLIDENRTHSGTVKGATAFLLFGLALLAAWAVSALVERPLTRRWGGGRPTPPTEVKPKENPVAT
jgi:peptidoglycan/LPS O-acetylase OafA/YrhL